MSNYTSEEEKNQEIIIEEKYTNKKNQNLELVNFMTKHITENAIFRMNECGSYLEFIADESLDNRKLNKANFCTNRFCPMCAWRKSKRDATQISILMEYLKKEVGYEFIFLTLTAPNVPGENLEEEIKDFNKSLERLIKRKEFEKINKGYIRKLEVTYDKEEFITKELYKKKKDYYKNKGLKVGDNNPTFNTYNPHFHIIIAVTKSYFTSKDYLSRGKFLELWKESKRDNRITQVKVEKITNKGKSNPVLEIAKYSSKDSEYTVNQDVFDIFYNALKGKQLITYNKAFKEVIKLYKNGDLDYLKEVDLNYYVYLVSHIWNFDENKYSLFNFKPLSHEEKLKYNKKLINEIEID